MSITAQNYFDFSKSIENKNINIDSIKKSHKTILYEQSDNTNLKCIKYILPIW